MKTYNAEELKSSLKEHALWLQDNLQGKRAEMQEADLRGADLRGADLQRADLQWANLYEANLQGANLQGANLYEADLQWADLQRANLQGANLQGANLQGANLQGANLQGANLYEADLQDAKMPDLNIPERGQFRGYKKVTNGIVLELLISAKKPRTASYVGNKCRCQKAKVLRAFGSNGQELILPVGTVFYSLYNNSFKYELGKWAEEPNYDGDPRVECAPGIHFFLTMGSAAEYTI